MLTLIKKLFGVPPQHKKEKEDHEVVTAPEFDITQYAKKLGIAIGVLVPVIAAALKAWKGAPTAAVVGALGVTAAALLSIALVSAVDIAARAFLSGEGSAQNKDESDDEDAAPTEVIAAPAGMQVWLKEGDRPHPVSALSSDGKKVTAYLVATGSTQERTVDGKPVKAIDGTVKWCDAGEVQAVRADGWP
jgi:hypothetical protein